MDKLKILMGDDAYFPDADGVAVCMHNYLVYLNEMGHHAVAAVPKNKKGTIDNYPYKVFRFKSIKVPFWGSYYGGPHRDKKLKDYVYTSDFDIIHIHAPFNICKFGYKASRDKNIPMIATFHTNFRPIFKKIVGKHLAERLVKNIGKRYNRLHEVFVCSEPVAEQLRSFGYTGKITYLTYGSNISKNPDAVNLKNAAIEKYGITSDDLIFIHVGRVMKLKRIDFVLEALKKVKEQGLKFKFLIAGEGMDKKYYQRYCNKLGLNDCVIFTGFITKEELTLLYSRANLLLFPSLYDNFGLVKVEAAAYSTPGLYIRGSNTAHGAEDNKNCFLSSNNVQEYAEKIMEAVSDKAKLKQIGIYASDTLYIHWKDTVLELEQHYKRIISEYKALHSKN